MKKSFLKKRKHQSEEMTLQITSMADIFTILLVFLLKSYASGAIDIVPANVRLPEAQGAMASLQALKVEVSENAILIEGKPAAQVNGFSFSQADLEEGGVSRSVRQALEHERAREAASPDAAQLMAKNGGKADSRIVVIADQKAPYSTIKTVLASAATQGYTDVKLAVLHEE